MSTLPEQFSAVRKSQVEAQLAFFQNMTAKAVEGAEKIIALNLNTTRTSMEKTTAAVSQLIAARDPRDLFALTTQSQENFDALMAYGRDLFTIATGAQASLLQSAQPAADVQSAQPAPLPLAAPAEAPAADAFPPAGEVKPIAKAIAKPALKPVAAPVTAEPEPVVVSSLKPVDSAPPPKAAGEAAQLDMLAAKAKKKK
jgi:phasin family protein